MYGGWTTPCCTRPHDGHGGPFPPGGAQMTPTRVRTLVIIAVVAAAGSWLLLRPVYSVLPPLPWTGVPALLLLAAAEAWSGRSLRARLRGRGKPVPPIAVARMAGRSATRLVGSNSERTWTLPTEAERNFSRQGVVPPRETR